MGNNNNNNNNNSFFFFFFSSSSHYTHNSLANLPISKSTPLSTALPEKLTVP